MMRGGWVVARKITLPKISLRSLCKMPAAYFRHEEGADQFHVTFHFENADLGVNRQFNFSRQVSESVKDLTNRVSANVEKALQKKAKKKKKETEDTSSNVRVEILKNSALVPPDTRCADLLKCSKNLTLHVAGVDYAVIMNAPSVDIVKLPASIMAGFPVYPAKFKMLFAREESSKFTWYRCATSTCSECVQVGSGYYYTPTVKDIGSFLKFSCVPSNGDVEGPVAEEMSKNVVEAGPGRCPFENRHVFTSTRLEKESFRVVSYNILADLYADSDTARLQLFPYCPPYALNVDYRKQLFVKEILGYNADLICLQEVDSKVFNYDLLPVLSSEGYDGVFEKKGKTVSEGLACFFHSSKYKLLDTHNLILSEELPENPLFSDLWQKIRTNEPLITRLQARTTSLQVTVLDCVNSQRCLVVGNTHLYFHPDADHIRLLQAGMIILYLQDILLSVRRSLPGKEATLLLCGDFNSTPECGVYQLMTQQMVTEDAVDWSSNVAETVKGVCLSHKFNIASACGTPDFTNYTEGFAGCLDYIFFQTDNLQVTQVVPLPTEEELKQHTALPNVVFPSDHLALVADLKWKES
ncbi:2',5'-phosphodiesterase 12 [Schistocerca gregaria]|uniref:2',5'-phosphodiesterase 12 n=1 Tax=Schistocerca gregaria TaxID=7010 RepID=UPI00211EA99B|nr:2',5'-phosphodiesterase 12 [Schistocerca gregaria]